MSQRIVTIGGGNGQSALLRGLSNYDVALSSVATVTDDGRSSGVLRRKYGILPPGDVRRCIVALAKNREELDAQWNTRDEQGMAQGNLVIHRYIQELGGLQEATDALMQRYAARDDYEVLPATNELATLVATLSNGMVIEGEELIDEPEHDIALAIEQLSIDPEVPVNPRVVSAIENATMVVFTMGDVYTSVIANLLPIGMTEALESFDGPIVLVCNRAVKDGETNGMTTADLVETFNSYLGNASVTHALIDDFSIALPSTREALRDRGAGEAAVIRACLADPEQPEQLSGDAVAEELMRLCATF